LVRQRALADKSAKEPWRIVYTGDPKMLNGAQESLSRQL